MPLRSMAFLLYFFGSSTAALVYPMAGLVCYVVVYHVYPQTTWWGIPLEPLGIRYAFVCGACLFIGAMLHQARLRGRQLFIHPVEIGSVLVFLTMLLTLATGVGSSSMTGVLLDKMAKVLLFVLMMTHVVVTRRRLWILTLVLMAMALYLGHEAKNAPPGAFIKNRLNGIGGPDFRESAGLAIHLCALLPFVAVVMWKKSWLLRATAFFAACYAINAVLLCRARSAFVALLAAALCAIWYAPRRFKPWIAILLIGASAGMYHLSDTWFWERMETIVATEGATRDASANIRLKVWAAAWDMFKANPMGVGVGQFPWQVKWYSEELEYINRDAHNTFVLCAGETGLPGLAAYVATLAMAWMTLGHAARRARRHLVDKDLIEWFILANRLAIVVYVSAGMFVSRYYNEAYWWFLLMPVCIARTVENEIAQTADEEAWLVGALNEWIGRPRGLQPQLGGALT